MPEPLAYRVPGWVRPYVPNSGYLDDSFINSVRLTPLTESLTPQLVRNEFTVKYSTVGGIAVDKTKTAERNLVKNGVEYPYIYLNTLKVSRPVGFYGVRVEARNYTKDEVWGMRKFPTDSFPLGIVSLDNSGRSLHAQKLQYGKQLVLAPQIIQLLSLTLQLGQFQQLTEYSEFSLNEVNGKIYYPDIPVEVSFLAIYELCIVKYYTLGG